jgi:hypothetical protein
MILEHVAPGEVLIDLYLFTDGGWMTAQANAHHNGEEEFFDIYHIAEIAKAKWPRARVGPF